MAKLTFAFVDLAGFTALTEAHGDEESADLIARFVELTRAALGSQDQLVKSIGDAVMVASPTPSEALGFIRRLYEGLASEPNFPIPRAGLHSGTAAEREGDYFGAAVNLAARVAGQAHCGQVLVTDEIVTAARQDGLVVHQQGTFNLRNIPGEVSLHEVEILNLDIGGAVDPVCRMRVDPERAAGRLRYGDLDYWFCSLRCASAFTNAPDQYVAAPGTEPD